jgi:hypothetical protein
MAFEREPLKTPRVALVADLFCGAGGSSTGARCALASLGFQMNLAAVNHWNVAIETHSRNHPSPSHQAQWPTSRFLNSGPVLTIGRGRPTRAAAGERNGGAMRIGEAFRPPPALPHPKAAISASVAWRPTVIGPAAGFHSPRDCRV